MAKVTVVQDEDLEQPELDVETDETDNEEIELTQSDDLKQGTSDGSGKGSKHTKKGTTMKSLKRRRKINPRSTASSFNVTKLLLIAGAGALLWDYLSGGGLLGLFGPSGLLSRMMGGGTQPTGASTSIPTSNAAPGTSPGSDTPKQGPTVNESTAQVPTQAPGTAPGTNPTPTAAPNPATDFAAYLQSIRTQDNQLAVNNTPIGGDIQRDADKFNNDPRFQQSTLVRGAQGSPYSVSILRSVGKRFNWDQWNWYRSQNGGTAVNLEPVGTAAQRNTDITIDTFLAFAGPDAIEQSTPGVSGLNRDGRDFSWLM